MKPYDPYNDILSILENINKDNLALTEQPYEDLMRVLVKLSEHNKMLENRINQLEKGSIDNV